MHGESGRQRGTGRVADAGLPPVRLAPGAGVLGFLAAENGAVVLLPPLVERVPAARHAAFIAVLWAHVASNSAGALGGLWLCHRVWQARQREAAVAVRANG
jgi:hypothetical protein